ncbi:MAG: cytochrome bc complex cytochrome b subunit [Armatimonadetes bacterium RBG_16_67_12]|nr:MAG: cytochrome bc complex cytochrome b subunit [Armatimonadetes bacterium RBG_16_67_12]
MSLGAWLEDRLRWRAADQFLRHKTVPVVRHGYVYYFGGVTLFLFLIQVFTGLLLLMYYRPTADAAYESVQFIMARVQFGWLIRSVHSWAANLMVLWVFAHMFGAFFLRAYRRPRELTWVSGALLLFLTLAFGFTGYLLPWNTLAYFATIVGTEIMGDVPLVGKPLLVLLRGGEDVTEATLSRFFGIHVAILPALATLVLGLHLFLVQLHGMSRPQERGPSRALPFVPGFVLRESMVWLLVLAVLAALAVLLPWPVGQKADPLAPAPAGIKPEWYFVFMFQTLKILPARVLWLEGEQAGIVAFMLAALVLLVVPFLERGEQHARAARIARVLGVLAALFIAGMTVYGYLTP